VLPTGIGSLPFVASLTRTPYYHARVQGGPRPDDFEGWARPTVNKHCGRVKRIVRWGVENEILPADRWEAFRAVKGLTAGHTTAPEPEPIGPVDEADYRAALPFVRPQARGLLQLLAVTGMRPGEACRIRPCDTGLR